MTSAGNASQPQFPRLPGCPRRAVARHPVLPAAAAGARGPRGAPFAALVTLLALLAGCVACGKPAGGPGGPGGPPGAGQAMPVPMVQARETEVRDASEYVATVKSRRSINVQPQVEGVVTHIYVKSGDRVAAGSPLLQIDPLKQRATVKSQEATRAQKQAALAYARQQEQRMETLYKGGAVSKQALEEAQTALVQAQADVAALGAQVEEQEVQLAYYKVVAPAFGVVGDIPVRVGDRVTSSTLLTTLDDNDALEVYISIPLERAKDLRMGLPVEILGENGEVLGASRIGFIAPQVDDQSQSVLVKAPVPNDGHGLRAAQFVRARVIWNTHPGLMVPVLAVSRVNGEFFIFTAEPAAQGGGLVARQRPVKLGEMVENNYVVLSGLKPGDQVIVAGVQKLAEGVPVAPAPQAPQAPQAHQAPQV